MKATSAPLLEQVRRYRDRGFALLQPLLRGLYFIVVLDKKTKKRRRTLLLISGAATVTLLWFHGLHIVSAACVVLTGALSCLSKAALWIEEARSVTQAPASSRHLDAHFAQRIRRMLDEAQFLPVPANSSAAIDTVAQLELEAFEWPSGKKLAERRSRLAKWLASGDSPVDGLGQLTQFRGQIIGYSVVIPISESQGQKFVEGTLKEWGLDVAKPATASRDSSGTTSEEPGLLLYAQAVYIRARDQGDVSRQGLAQAAAIHHLITLARTLAPLSIQEAEVQRFCSWLMRTRVLADEGSRRGGRFMADLGFTRLPRESADNRNVWELDLARAVTEQSPLHLTRLLIEEHAHKLFAPPIYQPRVHNA